MSIDLATILGTVAALCSIASFAPQAVKIWRERDASDRHRLRLLDRLWPVDPRLADHRRQHLRADHGGRRPDHEMAVPVADTDATRRPMDG